MRVKIQDSWYDPEEVPIMIELTDEDKRNIRDMDEDCTKYLTEVSRHFDNAKDAV